MPYRRSGRRARAERRDKEHAAAAVKVFANQHSAKFPGAVRNVGQLVERPQMTAA